MREQWQHVTADTLASVARHALPRHPCIKLAPQLLIPSHEPKGFDILLASQAQCPRIRYMRCLGA